MNARDEVAATIFAALVVAQGAPNYNGDMPEDWFCLELPKYAFRMADFFETERLRSQSPAASSDAAPESK